MRGILWGATILCLRAGLLGAMDVDEERDVRRCESTLTHHSEGKRWNRCFGCSPCFSRSDQPDSGESPEAAVPVLAIRRNSSVYRFLCQEEREHSLTLFEDCESLQSFWTRLEALETEKSSGKLNPSGGANDQDQLGQILPSPRHYDWLKKRLPTNQSVLCLFSKTALWERALSLGGWSAVATDVPEDILPAHMRVVAIDPLEALDQYSDRQILWTNCPPACFPLNSLVSQFKGNWWVRIDLSDDSEALQSHLWETIDQQNNVSTRNPHQFATITIYRRVNPDTSASSSHGD